MKFAIAGIAFILFVAAVVADQTTDSNEAVQAISGRRKMHTIYDEPCEKTLANTSDPKELIKQSFDASVKNISNVLKSMTLLKNATNDQLSKSTFSMCLEVLGRALNDLNTSVVLVDAFDSSTTKEAVQDVRVKVSAVGTNYGTCGDALYESRDRDKPAKDKMMNLLNSSRELSDIGSARFYCAYQKMWEEENVRDEVESVAEHEEKKKKKIKKKKKRGNKIPRGGARNVK